jgi:benzoylsuccinyl-CoA thiolase BbsB subunit
MGKTYVLGVGMTKFEKRPETPLEEMGVEALREALKDAQIDPKQIQAVYCGHAYQGVSAGQRVMVAFGFSGIPITNLENVCASGSCAIQEAFFAVQTGRYDICLALGVEKLSTRVGGPLAPGFDDLEDSLGLTFGALYALRARRYMETYGLTSEQLAKIAVTNRKNGYYNDKSSHGELISIEDVLNSRMVSDPLHLYDCNPNTDGAAAAIVVNEKIVKRIGGRPIEILASSLTSGKFEPGFIDMTFEDITWRSAQEAYEKAGVGPNEIDFAEVHDCFTIAEILRTEGLGLCKRGEMVRWIEEGVNEISGRKPINPSGGLLGKGHPLGATGVAQIREIVLQLRGEAGRRQIEGARIGLAHNRGGVVTGTEGAASVVTILRKP